MGWAGYIDSNDYDSKAMFYAIAAGTTAEIQNAVVYIMFID